MTGKIAVNEARRDEESTHIDNGWRGFANARPGKGYEFRTKFHFARSLLGRRQVRAPPSIDVRKKIPQNFFSFSFGDALQRKVTAVTRTNPRVCTSFVAQCIHRLSNGCPLSLFSLPAEGTHSRDRNQFPWGALIRCLRGGVSLASDRPQRLS